MPILRIYFTLQDGRGCELEGPEFLVLKLLHKFRYKKEEK